MYTVQIWEFTPVVPQNSDIETVQIILFILF